ncbi:mitochondrial 54S ribosomal protein uL24m [Kwoniella dejecticola CBS 10117]|uniref:KOW domain-containing protein n=1 Tax=Kwoniella dejecticola CBS 10117 TaxID=1296121 RepID=A0A1A6AF62_9TREE|nr:uncharacterized protein I303_00513 [Kwoniella dejecticola CBS 10117]OBR88696.1 hypothetical protein I303_00513 [Kwoniella dejecticola CBS 10117]
MSTAEPISRIPRGLHHIISTKPNKFAHKLLSRLPHASNKFVQPRDRVRKWNIRPGDKVRLLVGTPEQKFINQQDATEGWKTFTVKQVDLSRNRVFLEGVNNNRSNVIHARPSNYDSLQESQKQSYNDQKNFVPTMRPVHYSNVQLCYDDQKGPNSSFVSRMKTGRTHFNVKSQRLDWNRIAARISGGSDAPTGPLSLPWPKPEKQYQHPKPDDDLDTANNVAVRETLVLPGLEAIGNTHAADLVPQHINAPAPSDTSFSDAYINNLHGNRPLRKEESELVDLLMPLYLSDELSPRFGKYKTYKAYRSRREAEELERAEAGKVAVEEWELSGKDRGLKEVMELDEVGLEGVFIKPRTRKEVREAAITEFDLENESMRKEVNLNVRSGKVWSSQVGDWIDGPKAQNIARKQDRRERKERKALDRLANRKLEA